ncbi:transcriptional regulator [Williamsia sp. CHRR-6]|uniref:transcriptional regulator n=1 Tax=Williamsia sp. CHRR-6 TaxID=2835871 RepID=UPI001BDA9224|nr:transcriptional regulator [Williamsia sp. CHRR-6]MBT0568256.1 transcriptional regulator [Williamsia sp. CHRR-6]
MASSGRRRRPALIALVVVAALTCLGLAYWQWVRFESTSGTGQNLGYALQWPLFAAFVVYAYRRFVVLESDPEEVRKTSPQAKGPTEIPAELLPPRPPRAVSTLPADDQPPEDRVLAEYNEYLSQLAARDSLTSQEKQ